MKTGVIGASGYAGGELLRLLAIHPHFEVTVVSAHSNAGEQVTTVHPQLQSYAGRSFVSTDSIDFASLDLVFLALPHGESAALIEKIPSHVKIVDLGADFRLRWKACGGLGVWIARAFSWSA
jgi:N-acetyl-gamma-glutamyl-phosphate reductase